MVSFPKLKSFVARFVGCGGLTALLIVLGSCAHQKTDRPSASVSGEGVMYGENDLGTFYEVKAGDTLWAISRQYDVPVDELVEVNALDDVQGLVIGQLLFVPSPLPAGKSQRVTASPAASVSAEKAMPVHKGSEDLMRVGGSHMGWPVQEGGIIFRSFKVGSEVPYEGISLGAPEGTPVLAVLDGEVKYVGEEPNAFGRVLLLRHAQGYITVYAHMQKIHVAQGTQVRKGTVLGTVGQTGRTESPQLFFQVRHDRKPKNPLKFLSVKADE